MTIADAQMTVVLSSALLGLLGGAFVTVVAHRGPIIWGLMNHERSAGARQLSLSLPRSHCPACLNTLPIWAIIPLAGFVLSRGRCAHCGTKIPWRYPLTEALGLAVGILAALAAQTWAQLALLMVGGLLLLALAVIDAKTGYLPDRLTMPLNLLALVAGVFDVFVPLGSAVLGAAIGYACFAGISMLYERVRGQLGLGLGDAKLLAGLGALAGPFALPFIVLMACVTALGATVLGALLKREAISSTTALAFGPYLAFAGFTILLAQASGRLPML